MSCHATSTTSWGAGVKLGDATEQRNTMATNPCIVFVTLAGTP